MGKQEIENPQMIRVWHSQVNGRDFARKIGAQDEFDQIHNNFNQWLIATFGWLAGSLLANRCWFDINSAAQFIVDDSKRQVFMLNCDSHCWLCVMLVEMDRNWCKEEGSSDWLCCRGLDSKARGLRQATSDEETFREIYGIWDMRYERWEMRNENWKARWPLFGPQKQQGANWMDGYNKLSY